MRGEFTGVWSETWREIWEELATHETAPDDIFCELYREIVKFLKVQPTIEDLAEIIDDSLQSQIAFKNIRAEDFANERRIVEFLEKAHTAIDEFGIEELSNEYFNLLFKFAEKFSLRYELRRPCSFCPTLPGVFTNLVRNLKILTSNDAHLNTLMKDFESAIRDLRIDCSDNRIKTCIQKQINLLEALGRQHPSVTKNTLGAMCNEVGTWPHEEIKNSMKSLYTFTSDYPGIRHGGTPSNAIRSIEMRDMVAMSILLVGFAPYLTDLLDADVIYRGEL
jgi:hypothetical protein